MRKCIICEKPSLANNVCKALVMMGEKVERKEGYSQTQHYFVVPAFGHLFTLCEVEDYKENSAFAGKWTLENLPFFPTTYEFTLKKDSKTKKVDSGVKKQYEIIKKLVNHSDTEAIIHCGDSDREGEIIVRIILEQAKNKKPVYRLWLPDQVEKTIIHSLKTMENDTKYNALSDEGYARMFIDWNYGINLTRYATLKCNTLVKVGRVVSAIVKIIYDREMEIRNFVPEKYYALSSKENQVTPGGNTSAAPTGNSGQAEVSLIELASKHKFKFDEFNKAKELCMTYNSVGAFVTDIKKDKKIISSPKLFSQSGLQNILAKKYKYSPDKTLSLVQSLYEKGYVSYPRTPTEYLATAEKEKVEALIQELVNSKNENLVFKDKKSIFDDSKIESHSAITPTIKVPNLDTLTQDEKNCYLTIYHRFCAVFCKEDCIIDQTTMKISVGDLETFTLKGNVSVQKGWKAYEQVEEKEKTLPNLNIGDKVMIDFKPVEKETQPKKRYTVETLNNMLKNPFRDEMKSLSQVAPGGDKEETLSFNDCLDDSEEYKAILNGLEIGTEATRPGIIKGAIQSEYIALTKGVYSLLPKGEYIVNALAELGIDMSKEKTVFLGKTLKDVYKGEKTIEESLAIVNKEIKDVIVGGTDRQVNSGEVKQWKNATPEKEVLGNCPVCGKSIYETPKAYSCNGGRDGCGFVIWKRISSKTITKSQAVKLIKNKKTDKLKGFMSKNGKPFNARLVLKNGKVEFSFD